MKQLLSEFYVAGGRVCRKQSGSRNNIWFGNFGEQLAGIADVGRFAIGKDDAVKDVVGWPETRG